MPLGWTIVVFVAAIALGFAVWSHVRLVRGLDRPRGAPRNLARPSVSIVRPIRGLDAGLEANLQAAFHHGYPGAVETLFVLDDPSEPALPLVERAIAVAKAEGVPDSARVLFCGAPPSGRTGKLNAMILGLREARGELVAFADSDIRPSGEALPALVATLLAAPDVGAAFCPVVVTEPPRTAGDAGYALMLNGLYSPVAAMVARRQEGTLPFIMGQYMLFKRDTIQAIGGLASADGQLVDDMYFGQRVAEAGLRNAIAPEAVPIIQHGMGFVDFVKTYVRWLTFGRTGLPGAFKVYAWGRGIAFWAGLAAGTAGLLAGVWPVAVLGMAAPVAIAASTVRLHAAIGGARLRARHAWVAFALTLCAPFALIATHVQGGVEWRGRRYGLDRTARLYRPARAT
jgi:ceramide glucosyltransferase